MSDFADLIDGVIARQTRSNLVGFLARYKHIEFGRERALDASEIAVILTVIDRFLLDDSFAALGFAEFKNLTGKLASIAGMNDGQIALRPSLVRNACFDAMTCIKALEARLSKDVDRQQIGQLRGPVRHVGANDP